MQLSPEIKAGVTVLLSIILFATMAMAVGRIDFKRGESVELTLSYQNVDGLLEGAPVRYAGVNVGNVTAVQLASSAVLVQIRLDRELIIPADSRFVIATSGVLGDKYIEIQPGQAQEPLDITGVIAGVNPVSIDSMIHEVERGLRSLNQVIASITEITASDEIQASIAEAGLLLKDTVESLKTAVDQVANVAVTVQTVVDDVSVLTEQIPELDLRSTFADIQRFSQQLASVNLVDPINKFNQFASQLNTIPLKELAEDVQQLTQQLAAIDLAAIESDLKQFTAMLAAVEIQPLVDEIMVVTAQIKGLELDKRGEEIAQFTAQLAEVPLKEIASDLQLVADNLTNVPIADIGSNIHDLSVKLTQLPIEQIVADLQVVTGELSSIGWNDMAAQLADFTGELAAFDFEALLSGVTEDLHSFSHTLASLKLDELLAGVNDVVVNLKEVSTAVDPESVAAVMADLEGISANVHAVTKEINTMIVQLNADVQSFSGESLLALNNIKSIVAGVEQSIASINLFIEDVTAEGETAQNLRTTLANIEAGTGELTQVLTKISTSISSDSGVFSDLQDTMATIQKLNEDIEKVKTMGEKVNIKSNWSAHYSLSPDRRLMANIDFEFWPQDGNSFILVGISDILGNEGNHLQLQYGRQTGILRQRYGIIDTSLGIGLDGQVTDKWGLTAELKDLTTGTPTLTLQADYSWTPDWVIGLVLEDVLHQEGWRIGIERRF